MKDVVRLSLATILLVLTFGAHAGGLTDFSGNSRTISDYAGHGKWLVVMFWAHDCTVCNRDIASKVRFYDQHHNRNATVLGISLDGKANRAGAVAFIRRHKVSFPNLIGEPQDVVDLFSRYTGDDWVGTPTFLIFDPDGKVRAEQAGAVPNGLIEKFIRENSHDAAPTSGKT